MTPKDAAALLLLSALWGASFLFMRVAAPALGPVLLIELRVLLAGLALLGYGLVTRRLPPPGPLWRTFLVIGTVNSALPFVLIATAELSITASLAATLNATTPLFSALVAALWLGEALTPRKLAGLLLGFVSVVALVGLGPLPLTPPILVATALSLLAALSYGVGAVYTKARARATSPLALATYSQLFAAPLLLPAVPFTLPEASPSLGVVGSVFALALLCTALAYLLYFHLIGSIGPTGATMVTYLAPAFGILWGALFLSEPLGWGMLLGFALILGSVLLVSRTAPATKAKAPGVTTD